MMPKIMNNMQYAITHNSTTITQHLKIFRTEFQKLLFWKRSRCYPKIILITLCCQYTFVYFRDDILYSIIYDGIAISTAIQQYINDYRWCYLVCNTRDIICDNMAIRCKNILTIIVAIILCATHHL